MSDQAANRPEMPELAQHVIDELFEPWKKNRQTVEDKWTENRKAYHGEDNLVWKSTQAEKSAEDLDWHSTTVINVTKQKIMSAFALVSDSVLAGDDLPFMLENAPDIDGTPLNDELPPEVAQEADKIREGMEDHLKTQLRKGNATSVVKKSFLAGAIYGATWAKYAEHEFTHTAWQEQEQEVTDPETGEAYFVQDWEKVTEVSQIPALEYISNWDVFYDMEAEDPRTGTGIIQRSWLTSWELLDLADNEAYDAEAIKRTAVEYGHCGRTHQATLGDDDDTSTISPKLREIYERSHRIRMLECWVRIPTEHVKAYADWTAKGSPEDDTMPKVNESEVSGQTEKCLLVMAGDNIIRFQPLGEDVEKWPYYLVPWEEDLDEGISYGIADNMADVQLVLNGAIRSFEDNKKFSSSIILAIKERMIKNKEVLTNGKIKPEMLLKLGEDAKAVGDAVSAFTIPDVGHTLLPLIESMVQFADEESMVPRIAQGMDEGVQTAYEASLKVEKSGKYLAAVVKNFDQYLIGPFIEDMYDQAMLADNTPGKGNYNIQPLAFTSFQDRIVKVQALERFLSIVLQDEGLRAQVDLGELISELCKAFDLDPDQLLKSQDDEQGRQEAQAQQAEMQAVLGELEMEKARSEIDKNVAAADLDRAQADKAIREGRIATAQAAMDLQSG